MEGLPKFHSDVQLQEVESDVSSGLEQGVVEDMVGLRGSAIEGTAELKGSVVEITLYALLGSPSPSTMRILARIKQQEMVILIHSGSTHNFLDEDMWVALNLPLSSKDTFEVQIANGALIKTKGISYGVPLKVQGDTFKVDLNILPLGDCAVVLGSQWLYSLGLIQWDFNHLTMQFWYEGISVLLRGLQPSRPSLQEGEKFLTPAVKKGPLLQIVATPLAAPTMQPHPTLTQLLQDFSKVFKVPIGLSPLRKHEHLITLKEGSQPVCERPYRYPFYQKSEIEKIVKELLEARSIRASQSPFSSPVLLVRKADGSWRMCIDYRSLNKATNKDKYPILVVDELLDENCVEQQSFLNWILGLVKIKLE